MDYLAHHIMQNPTIDLDKVRFMINFDMVGRLNNEKTLAINELVPVIIGIS